MVKIQFNYIALSAVSATIAALSFPGVTSAASPAQDLVDKGATSVQIQSITNNASTTDNAGVQTMNGEPISDQSYFRGGSVTKTFTATIMMQLVDEGKVNLDAPVANYLSTKQFKYGNQITVRQLLSHRSGLSNDYLLSIPLNNPNTYPVSKAQLDKYFNETYSTNDLLARINSTKLSFTPGEKFQYANANFVVAGAIIEHMTGKSYAQNVANRIAKPLSMTHTYVPHSAQMPATTAHAYEDATSTTLEKVPVYDVTRFNPSQTSSAGEIVTTTGDLNKFSKALVQGKLMSPASWRQMSNTVDTGQGYQYGLGLIKLDTPCGAVYGHNGAIFGYATEMYSTADGSRQVAIGAAEGPKFNYIDLSGQTQGVAIKKLCSAN